MPTSMYCSGVNMKNTQNSVRWSPSRVGVSVMNSRSAQNEINPNRTTVATRAQQECGGQHRAHQPPGADAQVEALDQGRVEPDVGRELQASADQGGRGQYGQHAADQAQGSIVGHPLLSRRCTAWPEGRSVTSRRPGDPWSFQVLEPLHRVACPFQKFRLWLAALQPNRRTERHQAQQRHRQELAPRQHAVQIIDVHRHQFQVRPLFCQIIQPALEFPDFRLGVATPFGKHDQRLLLARFRAASGRPGSDAP